MPHPVAALLGGRVVPTVAGQIVSEYLCGMGFLEKLGCTRRFQRAPWMYDNSCFAVLDALCERFPVG